jgi:hypothetical protein
MSSIYAAHFLETLEIQLRNVTKNFRATMQTSVFQELRRIVLPCKRRTYITSYAVKKCASVCFYVITSQFLLRIPQLISLVNPRQKTRKYQNTPNE